MRNNIEMGLLVNCDVSLVIYVCHLNVLAHLFIMLSLNLLKLSLKLWNK
jgi:hypothetical protein